MHDELEKTIALALTQVGTTSLNNKVKYNTEYYGKEVSSAKNPWCCVMLWWIFQRTNKYLFYGGKKTSSCVTLLDYYRKNDKERVGRIPQRGCIVFMDFNDNKLPDHVGICVDVNLKANTCTTVEGNTGITSQNNGGCVMQKIRAFKNIVAVYYPRYKGGEEMTQNEFHEMFIKEIENLSKEPESSWSKMSVLAKSGITDGKSPKKFATREEVSTMIYNVIKKLNEMLVK